MAERWGAAHFHFGDMPMNLLINKEKSKYISYFKLQEALTQPGCPLCTLIDQHSLRYLDALLYERVNDGGTCQELRQSLGFCNWHAWKAMEISNCA